MQEVARHAIREYVESHSRAELLDQVLDEELPRCAEALERLALAAVIAFYGLNGRRLIQAWLERDYPETVCFGSSSDFKRSATLS